MATAPLLLVLLLAACAPDRSVREEGDDDAIQGDDDDDTPDDDDDTPDDDDATPDDDDVTPDDDDVTPDDDDATPDDDDAIDDDDATPDDDDDATEPTIRFLALGDTGEGYEAQHPNSLVMEAVCDAAGGCDFVLLLGDNFYEEGVTSVTDPLWDTHFEDPYANLDLPFYPVLGLHDGGQFGSGIDIALGDVQVDYSNYSSKWTMPARYYKHSWGNADFFALDTSLIFFDGLGDPFDSAYSDETDAQEDWLDAEWGGDSTGAWRIAYGHHTYLSNGPHGNAGLYEGIPFVPYVSGAEIQEFFDSHVCGQADLYLAGHDHSPQVMLDTCAGTQLIVSGAGAKTSDLPGSAPTEFQDATTPGFFFFAITGNTMTIEAWDELGTLGWSTTVVK